MRSAKCPALAAAALLLGLVETAAVGQDRLEDHPKVLLYPDGAPGAKGDGEADRPSLTIYAPPKDAANGCAIVVCPGGGYGGLALGHEGHEIGQWLNSFGVTAYILKYRLAPYRHPVPMQDVQRAIRLVRSRAGEWGVDPNRIGVLGFSAGGHLASTAATHFAEGDAAAPDQPTCRPDFAVLCYPVISLNQPFTHAGSRRNLLGENPDPELVARLSNETQVTKETPPTFLFHTTEDKAVPPENSIVFYAALRKAGVPCELHIYEKGPHGVGLATKDPALSSWPKRCEDWLRGRGLLSR